MTPDLNLSNEFKDWKPNVKDVNNPKQSDLDDSEPTVEELSWNMNLQKKTSSDKNELDTVFENETSTNDIERQSKSSLKILKYSLGSRFIGNFKKGSKKLPQSTSLHTKMNLNSKKSNADLRYMNSISYEKVVDKDGNAIPSRPKGEVINTYESLKNSTKAKNVNFMFVKYKFKFVYKNITWNIIKHLDKS